MTFESFDSSELLEQDFTNFISVFEDLINDGVEVLVVQEFVIHWF